MSENTQLVHTYADFKDCAIELSKAKSANGMSTQDAMLVIMRGREIGLPPATAMLSVHIVNGKPSLSARAKVASVQANPLCEYFEEVSASDTEATYETKRRGAKRVQTETFTLAEAERAGLLKNKTWAQYPKAMLRARASSALADRVYPDILLGLATEEVEYDLAAVHAPAGYVQPHYAPPVAVPALPAFDTAGYLARFAAAASESEVEAIALDLANASPDDTANAALLPAYEAAQLRVACLSESDWTAHLAAKDVTFEVANSLFKRAAAFEAAGVLDARTALAEARLEALGVPDPGAFLNAMYSKRAA